MSDRLKVLVLALVNGIAATVLMIRDASWMAFAQMLVNVMLLPGLADRNRDA